MLFPPFTTRCYSEFHYYVVLSLCVSRCEVLSFHLLRGNDPRFYSLALECVFSINMFIVCQSPFY